MADASETQHTPQSLNSPGAILEYLAESSYVSTATNEVREIPGEAFITALYSESYLPLNSRRRIGARIREAAQSGNYTEILGELRGEIGTWREAYANYRNMSPREVEEIVRGQTTRSDDRTSNHFTSESTHERIDRRLKELRLFMLLIAANMEAGELTSLEDLAGHFAAPTTHCRLDELGLVIKPHSVMEIESATEATPAAYSLSYGRNDYYSHFPPLNDILAASTFEGLVENIRVIQFMRLVAEKVSQATNITELAQELQVALLSCPTKYRRLIYTCMQSFNQYRLTEGADPVAYLTRVLIEHAAMPTKKPITARAILAKWVGISTPLDRTLTLLELQDVSNEEAAALTPFVLALINLKGSVKRGEYGPKSPMNGDGLESMNLNKLHEFILRLIGKRRASSTGHSNRF